VATTRRRPDRCFPALCALLDRLDDREDALDAPEVFALDAAALGEALAARRELLVELTEATQDLEGEAQTCDDPLVSGIVVVDLATGDARRVATGMAALPRWSPDGEWLVFGYAPVGEGPALGTWVARADGRQLREVVPSPAWFPVWLPPA
jgi:hypothetical protein